ncbi:hypothetical protein Tco_0991394 [Tanacetum coccineum]|uniref:Uncharacterized protein n=1 Tax=Tanacetum coccineum TaxID=301880 RepID=A0ABQ5F0D0_9ASTR
MIHHHLRTKENSLPEIKKELKDCEAKTANLQLMNLLRLKLRTYCLISNMAFLRNDNNNAVHNCQRYDVDKTTDHHKELVRIKSFDWSVHGTKLLIFSKLVMKDPPGAIIVQISPLGKYLMPVAIGQQSTKMPMS